MDGLFRGIVGILIGAALYSEAHPFIQGNLLQMGSFGKVTLPGILGVNHWALIAPLVAVLGGFLLWLDRKGL